MIIKRRFVVLVLVAALLTICLICGYHLAEKRQSDLFVEWMTAYNSGDDAGAVRAANKMMLFDQEGGAFYLAHVDISDSIHLSGEVRKKKLSSALKRLDDAWFHLSPIASEQEPYFLRASLSAMLGDNRQAVVYAKRSCQLAKMKYKSFDECLIGRYGFGDPYGSRYKAVKLYEQTSLYAAIDEGEKTEAMVYEAVALKYFDVAQARRIIYGLVNQGRFDGEMRRIYCNPVSPTDKVICEVIKGDVAN
jgi:hypothetical protein